ncbi:MAG: hypothetical protein HOV96_30765 [Nonomuraea sp.]|nr:hypothetical protein [Nonomuraea sp.]
MHKPRKTVVAAVLLGAVGFLGTGTAYANGYGDDHSPKHGRGNAHARQHQAREVHVTQFSQSTTCTTTGDNVDVQGQSGAGNGNVNGDGSPGTQSTNVGPTLGCNNTITLAK